MGFPARLCVRLTRALQGDPGREPPQLLPRPCARGPRSAPSWRCRPPTARPVCSLASRARTAARPRRGAAVDRAVAAAVIHAAGIPPSSSRPFHHPETPPQPQQSPHPPCLSVDVCVRTRQVSRVTRPVASRLAPPRPPLGGRVQVPPVSVLCPAWSRVAAASPATSCPILPFPTPGHRLAVHRVRVGGRALGGRGRVALTALPPQLRQRGRLLPLLLLRREGL